MMLKTISFRNLIAVLIVTLVSTPILVVTSHGHLFSGGDGHHTLQSHTCTTHEVHKDLHAGDTCSACLRAGLFAASFPADLGIVRAVHVNTAVETENPHLLDNDDLACPKRGPPTLLA